MTTARDSCETWFASAPAELASTPPKMRASSAPTGRPMAEMKLSTKTAP